MNYEVNVGDIYDASFSCKTRFASLKKANEYRKAMLKLNCGWTVSVQRI